MSTGEVLQVQLEGMEGTILFPGSSDEPPEQITDTDLRELGTFRIFDHPNPNGVVFEYKRDMALNRWDLLK